MNPSNLVYITVVLVSVVSIIGCSFIIVMYNKFPSLQIFPFKLVYVLTLFDIINSIFSMIPTYLDSSELNLLCIIQGLVTEFSALAGILWTGVIALLLYLQVVLQKTQVEKSYIYLLWSVLTMSLVCSLIPLFTNDYKYIGGWCGVTYTSERGVIYRYTLFYAWVWIVIIFDIYAYVRVISRIRQEFTIMNSFIDEGRVLVKRLRYYPMILVICYAPITVMRILQLVGYSTEEWLEIAALGIVNLLGFFNAIVWVQ